MVATSFGRPATRKSCDRPLSFSGLASECRFQKFQRSGPGPKMTQDEVTSGHTTLNLRPFCLWRSMRPWATSQAAKAKWNAMSLWSIVHMVSSGVSWHKKSTMIWEHYFGNNNLLPALWISGPWLVPRVCQTCLSKVCDFNHFRLMDDLQILCSENSAEVQTHSNHSQHENMIPIWSIQLVTYPMIVYNGLTTNNHVGVCVHDDCHYHHIKFDCQYYRANPKKKFDPVSSSTLVQQRNGLCSVASEMLDI